MPHLIDTGIIRHRGRPAKEEFKLLKTRRLWRWAIVLMCVGMWAVALGYGISVLLPPPTQISGGWPQSFILVPIVLLGGIIVLAVTDRARPDR